MFCVNVAIVPYFSLNPIRSGVAFKAALPKFCRHAFNSVATLLWVGDFSIKFVSHRVAKTILIRGQDLAVKGGSQNLK